MIATPDLVSIGEDLAAARSAKGLSVEDIAHETRIPAAHIHALEAGDYKSFDGVGYARSFLRLYGTYLSVDVTDGLAQLEERRELSGGVNHYPFLDAPDKVKFASEMVAPRSSAVPLVTVVLAMILVIAVPVAFLVAKQLNPSDEPAPATFQNGANSSNQAAGGAMPIVISEPAPPTLDLTDIVKVPPGQLERIRDQVQPEVRRAELVVEEEDENETESVDEPSSSGAEDGPSESEVDGI